MKTVLLKQEVYQKMFRRFNQSMDYVLKNAESLGEVTMTLDGYIIRFKRKGKKVVRRWKHDEQPAIFTETAEKKVAKKATKKSAAKRGPGRPKGSKNGK